MCVNDGCLKQNDVIVGALTAVSYAAEVSLWEDVPKFWGNLCPMLATLAGNEIFDLAALPAFCEPFTTNSVEQNGKDFLAGLMDALKAQGKGTLYRADVGKTVQQKLGLDKGGTGRKKNKGGPPLDDFVQWLKRD